MIWYSYSYSHNSCTGNAGGHAQRHCSHDLDKRQKIDLDALRTIGVTYKKSPQTSKGERRHKQSFEQRIKAYETAGKPLVYTDGSGFAHDMPHTHGYADKGNDVLGYIAKGRTHVIGAILGGAMLTLWLCDFNIESDVFHTCTLEALLPNLPPASGVIFGNAAFHKRKDPQEVITKAGHILEYLPPYSPDLNPIEHKWAQAKPIRRKTGKSVRDIFKHEG